jgi:hypothetical protein
MKKLLFTAGTVAVLALASCSNDEIVNLNPTAANTGLIRYNAVMNNASRANTLYDSSSHPDFYVYAKVNKAAAESQHATYINGDFVQLSGDEYTYPERYWPDVNLDFFAYVGKNEFGSSTATVALNGATADGSNAEVENSLSIKGIQINPDAAKQEDMLYAISLNQNGLDSNNESQDVPLFFRHALAQLNFQFANRSKNIQVKVDGIRIVGMKTKGDVLYQASTKEGGQVLEDATDYNNLGDDDICKWDNLGVEQSETAIQHGSESRLNWSYATLDATAPITLTSTPQQLTESSAKAPVAGDYFELVNPTGKEEGYEQGTKDQQAADFAALVAGTDLIAPTVADELSPTAIESGMLDQYNSDNTNIDAAKESYKEDLAAYNTAVSSNKKFNAVYVIPQSTEAGKVDADKTKEFTVNGNQVSYNTLTSVEGMYFLIKCSIQNSSKSDGTADANDLYLYGKDGKTAYIYVPLRAEDYETYDADNNGELNKEETTNYINEWKAGRKYIYTFYFGEKGSNAGIPVTDPDPEDPGKDPGVDPDPDPDDDSIIDTDDPTLRLITYTVKSIKVDDFQTAGNDDVNVTYDKSKDSNATETSGTN